MTLQRLWREENEHLKEGQRWLQVKTLTTDEFHVIKLLGRGFYGPVSIPPPHPANWLCIACLSGWLAACLIVCLSVCLAGCLSVWPPDCLSACLLVCLSVCLSVWVALI